MKTLHCAVLKNFMTFKSETPFTFQKQSYWSVWADGILITKFASFEEEKEVKMFSFRQGDVVCYYNEEIKPKEVPFAT